MTLQRLHAIEAGLTILEHRVEALEKRQAPGLPKGIREAMSGIERAFDALLDQAVLVERERCAVVAETYGISYDDTDARRKIAAKIRGWG